MIGALLEEKARELEPSWEQACADGGRDRDAAGPRGRRSPSGRSRCGPRASSRCAPSSRSGGRWPPGGEDGDLRSPQSRLVLSIEADLERLSSRAALSRAGAAALVRAPAPVLGSAPGGGETGCGSGTSRPAVRGRDERRGALDGSSPGIFAGTAVSRISYLHLPPLGAPDARRPRMQREGFPEELVARYIEERHYRDNPVVVAARRAARAGLLGRTPSRRRTSNEREQAFVEAYQRRRPRLRGRHPGLRPERAATATAGSGSRRGCGGCGRRCCGEFQLGLPARAPALLRDPDRRRSGRRRGSREREVEVLGWVARRQEQLG